VKLEVLTFLRHPVKLTVLLEFRIEIILMTLNCMIECCMSA